ncbi:MAG: carboxypeptidase family protein, partial [Gammaproteobacteria bacterium]|nr:carboxypeptidase family protein [Gammaproteobacteria bacterium]
NKSMLFRISIIIAVITVSKAFAQLQIDSNYDSGNIGSYTIDGNDIEFIINSDALNYTYWTSFRLSGVLNQQVTFRITNADDVPFLSDTVHESQMVFSYNGDDWYRLTNNSYDSGTYTITETFTQDTVQIATFFPFSYQKMHDYVDLVKSSDWVTESILGSSHQGRDIDLLTITNTSVPSANKKIIYIIGRQHSAE